jgi:hypothetical protein
MLPVETFNTAKERLRGVFDLLNWVGRKTAHVDQSPGVSESFIDLVKRLLSFLETDRGSSSERVRDLLHKLRASYPVPAVDIMDKDVWGLEKDQLVLRTHEVSNVNDAKRNLGIAGMNITSAEDEILLKYIMSHWCGWAPTRLDHHHDPWLRHLRDEFARLGHLVPILDTLIWPDEITRYPPGSQPARPWLFLLASGAEYYVYDFQNLVMNHAGASLREVFAGLRNRGWEIGGWDKDDDDGDRNPKDYFPVYSLRRNDDGQFKFMGPVHDFPAGNGCRDDS